MDIWNIDQKKPNNLENSTEEKVEEKLKKIFQQIQFMKCNLKKRKNLNIQEDETLLSKKIEISGLYDPVRKWSYN